MGKTLVDGTCCEGTTCCDGAAADTAVTVALTESAVVPASVAVKTYAPAQGRTTAELAVPAELVVVLTGLKVAAQPAPAGPLVSENVTGTPAGNGAPLGWMKSAVIVKETPTGTTAGAERKDPAPTV